MTFYDTSNPYNSLCHYANDLLNLPSADTTTYTLAQKARAANTAKYKLATMLFLASDAWEWDDNGYSDLPIATTTLVAGQRDYSLPTTALTIERVEVMDNGGNYYRLMPMDETERDGALTGYGESSATPTRYWVKGRSIFLDPAPASGSVTLAAGLKVYFSRDVNEFNASTTTSNVGFDEVGDRIIAYMVAEEFAARKGKEVLKYLQESIAGMVAGLTAKTSKRLRDRKPRIRIRMENME